TRLYGSAKTLSISSVESGIAGGLIQLAILFYALVFMASQGMFIISNPRETWVLFWLPLGIALSKGLAEKR
ncbi:hypothetical protein Q6284_29305, partial [Klebsiella pneumoniae]|nr:hypothetical protein [Klebsiella pneumoniae]